MKYAIFYINSNRVETIIVKESLESAQEYFRWMVNNKFGFYPSSFYLLHNFVDGGDMQTIQIKQIE